MHLQPHWISKGRTFLDIDEMELPYAQEADLLHRHGVVKVVPTPKGTTIQWVVFSPNWSSLYWLMDVLEGYPAPYTLEFFLVGWFAEKFDAAETACERISELIAKSDVHILSRTFVRDADPEKIKIPDILQDALSDGTARPDYSVDCVRDPADDRFKVIRIGERSQIAKSWGLTPISYPCVNGGSYDQIVSAIYPKVMKTGEPHYGHVYAAMNFPDEPVKWFPYQRVVLPLRMPDGTKGVTVLSRFADVDIKII